MESEVQISIALKVKDEEFNLADLHKIIKSNLERIIITANLNVESADYKIILKKSEPYDLEQVVTLI